MAEEGSAHRTTRHSDRINEFSIMSRRIPRAADRAPAPGGAAFEVQDPMPDVLDAGQVTPVLGPQHERSTWRRRSWTGRSRNVPRRALDANGLRHRFSRSFFLHRCPTRDNRSPAPKVESADEGELVFVRPRPLLRFLGSSSSPAITIALLPTLEASSSQLLPCRPDPVGMASVMSMRLRQDPVWNEETWT